MNLYPSMESIYETFLGGWVFEVDVTRWGVAQENPVGWRLASPTLMFGNAGWAHFSDDFAPYQSDESF